MKKLLTGLLFLLLVSPACKKEGVTISPVPAGSWSCISSWKDAPPDSTNPITPKITGNQVNLIIYSNFYWKEVINGLPINSGTYSLGHGSYTPYKGAYTYIYDSVIFNIQNSTIMPDCPYQKLTDYYQLSKDTLLFCGCFRGLYGAGVTTYV